MTSTTTVIPAAQGTPAAASGKPVILVTGADLAPQAVEILHAFEIVYAGKTPDEEGLVGLCQSTEPVGIIVRYGKISARIMDASTRLRVISKHGVGIDTIDTAAAAERGVAVKAATGANADAVAVHTWALPPKSASPWACASLRSIRSRRKSRVGSKSPPSMRSSKEHTSCRSIVR